MLEGGYKKDLILVGFATPPIGTDDDVSVNMKQVESALLGGHNNRPPFPPHKNGVGKPADLMVGANYF